ncbi:MAG: O-antigen ligase family protein [Verrucomicrobiae bacterium]|nr:O-antigen ligase family protein [Verrucomicrobiae bacterium]
MRRPTPIPSAPTTSDPAGTAFACIFGLLLGVGLLKFGNPVLLDRLVDMPRTLDEWRAFAWPLRLAFLALVPVAFFGLWVGLRLPSRPVAPRLLLALPLVWLAWQTLAASQTIDPAATRSVLPQLGATVVCFFLGYGVLSRVAEPRVFWLCLTFGLVGVLGMAFEQRFGGLEATRRMILEQPNAAALPPEYLARIQSDRVFSTLVYPNALAGALLLLVPVGATVAWHFGHRWGQPAARALGAGVILAGIAALIWSGSKAGWLIAMGLGVVILCHSSLSQRFKLTLVVGLMVTGLAGFAWAYAEKLRGGATSVAARFDYWEAALEGAVERPLVGHGPGAFKRVYSRLKRPESEMAQLAHNDYLQQATDSGWPGFLAYLGWIWGVIGYIYRKSSGNGTPIERAVGLGLLGWFTQGWVEFGLYLPATAWCAFTLLGWLLAQWSSTRPP